MTNIDFNNIATYYNKLDNNHRYLSWEHCYSYFYENFYKNNSKDYDTAALHLAFYLASWGMYRGSSFLLGYDYKIHVGLIEKLFETVDYKILWEYDYKNKKDDIIEKIVDASKDVDKYYSEIKGNNKTIAEKNKKSEKYNISEILISKILLGIFGCVPAFDRFFKFGLSLYKNQNFTQQYNSKNFDLLIDFISKNEIFTKNNYRLHKNNIPYPPMKLVDMYFWQIGYNNSFKKILISDDKIILFRNNTKEDGALDIIINKDEIRNELENKNLDNFKIRTKDNDLDEVCLREFISDLIKKSCE